MHYVGYWESLYLKTSWALSDFCIGVGKLVRTASEFPIKLDMPPSHVETLLASTSFWPRPPGLSHTSPMTDKVPKWPLLSARRFGSACTSAGRGLMEAVSAGQEGEGASCWWAGLISASSLACSHFAGSLSPATRDENNVIHEDAGLESGLPIPSPPPSCWVDFTSAVSVSSHFSPSLQCRDSFAAQRDSDSATNNADSLFSSKLLSIAKFPPPWSMNFCYSCIALWFAHAR